MTALWIGVNHGILQCDHKTRGIPSQCTEVFDGKRGESPASCVSRAKGQGWIVKPSGSHREKHICPSHKKKYLEFTPTPEELKEPPVPKNVKYIDETPSWRKKHGRPQSN